MQGEREGEGERRESIWRNRDRGCDSLLKEITFKGTKGKGGALATVKRFPNTKLMLARPLLQLGPTVFTLVFRPVIVKSQHCIMKSK